MASACVKSAGVSQENFSAFKWTSPRMSLTREDTTRSSSLDNQPSHSLPDDNQDPLVDFEFCLEDPVSMLSADELFSDGKLVPLKFCVPKTTTTTSEPKGSPPEVLKSCRRLEMEISDLFSPKAPRCTTRWRELLGFKKLANAKSQQESVKPTSSSSSSNPKTSSFKQFLHRSSKSSAAAASASASDSLPLLKETDISESISIASSRLSLSSSSSSGHEIDDLPRLSLDIDKPSPNPFAPARTHLRNPNQPRIRLAKPRRHHHPPSNPSIDGTSSSTNITTGESRGVTVTADSPRLNASGKIVFHGLERSSSSPGSFTGGPRMQQNHGMPRSYSANVRITPVLNVPVCSLKSGLFFGQLFSSSSSASSSSASSPSQGNKSQVQSNGKNRSNRSRLEPKLEQKKSSKPD